MRVSKIWQKVHLWVNYSFKINHFDLTYSKWSGESTEEHLLSQPSLSSLTRQTHFSISNKTALVDHQLSCISQNGAGYLLGILSWANTYFYIHDPHVHSSKFDKIGFFLQEQFVIFLPIDLFIYLLSLWIDRSLLLAENRNIYLLPSLKKVEIKRSLSSE